MLKRLELIGFKSFAEKTQFDFGPGITAIVGPNGSGKSNVVDAVRWILGEQSAKSLRGGEMADVIFNGSTTRRSLGMAEVTLTLDNSKRVLGIEADEVQVTRRVYRSGEGEYLINKQPARLRDIKDLFLGSGAGADAYCIIAQGRVEAMLQASTRDRRTIFEEAAGISRFKAKKAETLRKLEHTDQNLQRLRDIMEEVERQLRNVRLQAAKAQRYREYSERLKELRIALSLEEYDGLAQQLSTAQERTEQLRGNLKAESARIDTGEMELHNQDRALAELDRQGRAAQAALAGAQERIATSQTALQHEWQLLANLEDELAQARLRACQLRSQLGALTAALKQAESELAEADVACVQQARAVAQCDQELLDAANRLAELRKQADHHRTAWLEHVQLAARLHNELVSFDAQIASLESHRRRIDQRTTHASTNLQRVDLDLAELGASAAKIERELLVLRQELQHHRQERERTRQTAESVARRLVSLREERSSLAGRIAVLETLEQRRDGLNSAVKRILEAVELSGPDSWGTVQGLVADLLTVQGPHAQLIDAALGERAQALLFLDSQKLRQTLESAQATLEGRVIFLPYSGRGAGRLTETLPLEHPGLVAAAVSLVSCTRPELDGLAEQLLGRTLIVKDLAAACEIMAQLPGWRCVTLLGEVLESDGTLTIGSAKAEVGILSRKSELRELRQNEARLDEQLANLERELGALRERLTGFDQTEVQLHERQQALAAQDADIRSRMEQHKDRQAGLTEEVKLGHVEMRQVELELEELRQSRAKVQERASDTHRSELESQMVFQAAEAQLPTLEEMRRARQEAVVAARVALAKAEERREAVVAKLAQSQEDYRYKSSELERADDKLSALVHKIQQSRLLLLQTHAQQAEAYLHKETSESVLRRLELDLHQVRQERDALASEIHANRERLRVLQGQVHERELEISDLRHRMQGLCTRLQEDHEVDLAALHKHYQKPSLALDHQAALEEIAELRKKIARLGSVSLDSLQELQELEARAGSLQTQLTDLLSAKASLEEIINRINNDSRKLFSDTLESVRGHFQELFRKLFGGGMADIVLEDPEDILESGIEIIARPPGKELRSISLLSGGEKTLTAVALLLAIFRSKPSPFCILDEVDAALDEANTGRFSAVLREFLDRSQFIMITHSKKTMAMADVLYGITMQEAGVSKRVAVRMEDWPDTAAA